MNYPRREASLAPPTDGKNGTRVPRRIVRFEIAPRTMIVAVLIVAAIWMLVKLLPVLLVVVAALMLVGALNPVVGQLEKRRVGRKLGIGIVFTLAVGATALVLFFSVPPLVAQLKSLVENEPEIRER